MQNCFTLRENIEAQLDLLGPIDIIKVEKFIV